ncbi:MULTISPECIES: site-specific DNA-methyltransferase [Bacillaceae]|uniref:DNA methylase N-4 n=1 Tax=Oceanobacillus caeni TaxID=405946 RepID=A0ABR5MG31_9BACI|nr:MULTISPECIES: site-specific DNA-methyltransferase [Bacillaceae]KPH71348.1 DNA methylase N-4 [Oceanobacillus caeni]
MEKIDGKTLDLTKENINTLKKLFPEIVTEGKVDFDKLKLILGEEINDRKEKYEFTWHGKAQSLKLAQKPSTGTLRPDKESSKKWDSTENLYIEGDNLEVLKLMQKSYFGKVKMIYIDPPYNTGQDFVYHDDFRDNIKNYKEITKQASKANTETNGRYHTDWLNLMYPRLKIARNLLKDDGVIFISIDDNEVANLRKICDEIFGEDNLIVQICHKARGSVSNDKVISPNHNHILLYAKNFMEVFKLRKQIGLDPELEGFSNDDNDQRGPYKLVPVDGPGGERKGNPYYEFLGVRGYFRYSKDTMEKMHKDGIVVKRGNSLLRKYYLEDAKKSRKTVTSWWDNVGYTSTATTRLKKIMETGVFDSPKPVDLIYRMLKLFVTFDKDALVLDFFSGSATTAQAVMQINQEDNGRRKFIMVQLPESTDEKSEAYKAGYLNICEIGKERIRRAGEKIIEEIGNTDLDIGFKVFKLESSNLKTWDPNTENLEQDLFDLQDNIKDGRSKEDLLYEILLKVGISLTTPIEEVELNNKVIYNVGFGGVLLCLEDEINLDTVQEMIKLKPEDFDTKVIFKETGFLNDSVKTNAIQTLKKNGITDVRSV